MTFKDIASISGKSGLYLVVKATRTGMLLESLDEKKTKVAANANSRVSVLSDISIYTTNKDSAVPLPDVLRKMNNEFKEDLGVEPNSDGEELKAFFKHVIADYDTERFYVSHMKKIVAWYGILLKYTPEVFEKEVETTEVENNEPAKES